MKTLVFYGSARSNGRTREMLDVFQTHYCGEMEVIRAYQTHVSPCRDCRYCLSHPQCCIKDAMLEIYQKIQQADHLLFLAPIYFFGIPGPMKTMLDRLQCYWAAHVRGDKLPREQYQKTAAIILAGGAPCVEDQFTAALLELRAAADDCNCTVVSEITMNNADAAGIAQQPDIAEQICQLARKFS